MNAVAARGDEKGIVELEKENRRLREELSSLPELKEELESLRVRVTELSKLTSKILLNHDNLPVTAFIEVLS